MSNLKRTSAVVTSSAGPRIVWYEVMAVILSSAAAQNKKKSILEDGANVAGRYRMV